MAQAEPAAVVLRLDVPRRIARLRVRHAHLDPNPRPRLLRLLPIQLTHPRSNVDKRAARGGGGGVGRAAVIPLRDKEAQQAEPQHEGAKDDALYREPPAGEEVATRQLRARAAEPAQPARHTPALVNVAALHATAPRVLGGLDYNRLSLPVSPNAPPPGPVGRRFGKKIFHVRLPDRPSKTLLVQIGTLSSPRPLFGFVCFLSFLFVLLTTMALQKMNQSFLRTHAASRNLEKSVTARRGYGLPNRCRWRCSVRRLHARCSPRRCPLGPPAAGAHEPLSGRLPLASGGPPRRPCPTCCMSRTPPCAPALRMACPESLAGRHGGSPSHTGEVFRRHVSRMAHRWPRRRSECNPQSSMSI